MSLPAPPDPTDVHHTWPTGTQISQIPQDAAERAFLRWITQVTSRNAGQEQDFQLPPPPMPGDTHYNPAHPPARTGGAPQETHPPPIPHPRHPRSSGGSSRHHGPGTPRVRHPRAPHPRTAGATRPTSPPPEPPAEFFAPVPGLSPLLYGQGPGGGPTLTTNTGGTYVFWEPIPAPLALSH